MDLDKLTDRARGFLQAAQTIAVREHHQRIAPAHLLKALLDDEQGMAAGLIDTAGGDSKIARREVDAGLLRRDDAGLDELHGGVSGLGDGAGLRVPPDGLHAVQGDPRHAVPDVRGLARDVCR